MSAKLAAIAALLTLVSVAGPVFARNHERPGTSFDRSPNDVFLGGKTMGRDPDSNIRFELRRDNNRSQGS
jgi:hypothetical protein